MKHVIINILIGFVVLVTSPIWLTIVVLALPFMFMYMLGLAVTNPDDQTWRF